MVEHASEDRNELTAMITGTVDKQVIIRDGAKQRLLFCTDQNVLEKIESVSPRKAKLAVNGEDIIDFSIVE